MEDVIEVAENGDGRLDEFGETGVKMSHPDMAVILIFLDCLLLGGS